VCVRGETHRGLKIPLSPPMMCTPKSGHEEVEFLLCVGQLSAGLKSRFCLPFFVFLLNL
jgi:hypothetical protein